MFKIKNFFKNKKKWWISLSVVTLTPIIFVSCGTQNVNVTVANKDNTPINIQTIVNNEATTSNESNNTQIEVNYNSNDIVLSEDKQSIIYKGNIYKSDNSSINNDNIYKPLYNKAIISSDEKSILLNGKTYKLVPKLKQKLDDATFELVKDQLINIKTVQMFGNGNYPITIALYSLFTILCLLGILVFILKLKYE